MVDLTVLNDYVIELDKHKIEFVANEIETIGLSIFLEYDFKLLDCSRVGKSGNRLMQTIGYTYRYIISETIHIIDNYVEDNEKDDYKIRLLQIHNSNIEYEKTNPPVWYGGEKAKRKFEKDYKTKSKRERKTKEKGPSVSEKKLAARVAKINALSFKIKPIS